MIELEINKTVKSLIPRKKLEKALKIVREKLKLKKDYSVSLAIISPKVIKDLNSRYRKKNKVTDVLSFTNIENFKTGGELGEILICFSQAQKQAKQKKHSVQKEFLILFIHGLLHLFGYDHKTATQAKKMEALEALILNSIDNNKI